MCKIQSKYDKYKKLIPFRLEKSFMPKKYAVTNIYRDEHRFLGFYCYNGRLILAYRVYGMINSWMTYFDIHGKAVKTLNYEYKWHSGGFDLRLSKVKK